MIDKDILSNLVAYMLQSSVLVVVALAALRLLRIDAPGLRYGALRTTLALALVLPVVQPRVVSIPLESVSTTTHQGSERRSVSATAAVAQPAAIPAPGAQPSWVSAIATVLVAGVLGRLLWLSAGLWRLRALRRAGESAAGEDHADLQHVIGTRAELRYVAGLEQPLTFGFRRPVVLLPGTLRRMPSRIQRAVVAHELWHVRRLDWLWMVGEEVLRSALWFHPAIWILLSHIQVAREETVDRLAILTIGSRRCYLDALLAFADARPLFPTAAFARRRHLVHRMLMISKENLMSSTRFVASCAGLMCVLISAAWSAAAAFPMIDTQTPPRDPQKRPEAPASQMVFVPASEEKLRDAIVQEPKNPENYRALAALYLKTGDFDRAIGTLEALAQADPSNAQHHHQVGVFYWEKAFKDAALPREQKMTYILSGIAAEERALTLDPEYAEAMIYKNILLRLQASLATDVADQRRLIAEADALRSRAMELQKQRGPVRAAHDPLAPPPPPPPPPPSSLEPVDGMMPVRVGGSIQPPQKIRDVKARVSRGSKGNWIQRRSHPGGCDRHHGPRTRREGPSLEPAIRSRGFGSGAPVGVHADPRQRCRAAGSHDRHGQLRAAMTVIREPRTANREPRTCRIGKPDYKAVNGE